MDHDIFRDLDTDLIEIFNRRQLADLFADIPLEEQNERLDRLNEVLSSRNIDEYLRRRMERGADRGYVSYLWKFGIIPLPIFNYRRAWRRLRPNNVREFLMKVIAVLMTTLVRLFRLSLFFLGTSMYLHNILRNLFTFSNIITFSLNFLRDMITYIFRNNEGLLERHKEIIVHDENIFYFNEVDGMNSYPIWKVATTAAYNWLSHMIRMNCMTLEDKENRVTECVLQEDLLIFKFSRVLKDFFPSMANSNSGFSSLTISTVLLFLFYALGGDVICLNVLFFWSFNLGKKVLHYKDVYSGLGRILWNTLHRNIV